MRILIADDDNILSLLYKNILSKYGECVIAKDGMEALDDYTKFATTGQAFDIVILDVVMPIFSGYKILEEIRRFEKSNNITPAKIIMVSGIDKNNKSNQDKIKKMGADDFLSKPLKYKELMKIINKYFNDTPEAS